MIMLGRWTSDSSLSKDSQRLQCIVIMTMVMMLGCKRRWDNGCRIEHHLTQVAPRRQREWRTLQPPSFSYKSNSSWINFGAFNTHTTFLLNKLVQKNWPRLHSDLIGLWWKYEKSEELVYQQQQKLCWCCGWCFSAEKAFPGVGIVKLSVKCERTGSFSRPYFAPE